MFGAREMDRRMTEYNNELLEIIHGAENPGEAIVTACEIVISYLMRHESSQEQASAYLREPG